MTRYQAGTYRLALAAALLAAAPLGVAAQAPAAPPAPTAPPAPGGPGPGPTGPGPTNPPAPTPTGPPPPLGGGGGGGVAPVTPPPPPPTPPAPNATAPAGGVPGGVFVPTPALPISPLPSNQLPDVAPPPQGTPGTLLRYKFHTGQTISYHLVVDTNGNVQMGAAGTGQPIKLHLEMTLAQTVKSVDTNGAATISEQVSGLTTTLNGQAIPLPPQSQQQLQQPFTAVLTPTGQVLSIKTAAASASSPFPGMDPSQLSQFQGLPKAAVVVGDKWRSDVTSAVAGVETHIAYSLTGLSTDGDTATISQKIYEAFKPAAPGTGQAPPMKLNGLLTGTGTQQFDVAAGQIASQTNNLTLDLTVTPATAGAQAVKSHMDITTTLQRQSGQPAAGTPAPTDEPPTAQLQ